MSNQPVSAGKKGRKLRTMDDLPLDGKRVLVRVDFDVSLAANGTVGHAEDYRIEAALPTINELRQRRCKIILVAHMGRPQEEEGDFDLGPAHRRLEDLLGEEVLRTKKLFGSEVESVVNGVEPGGVVLLPNVRLDEREVMGNQKFAGELASNADAYVNEAFATSHRAHSSIAFVPQVLPSCAGRRLVEEVRVLEKLRENPDKPYVAIASGAKISDKIGLLRGLLTVVDTLCIGGQLANVFLAAKGQYPKHTYSADDIAAAQSVLQIAGDKLVIPGDVVIGPLNGGTTQIVAVSDIPVETDCLCDIGPLSVQRILEVCKNAKTIMWNGPVGKFELPEYALATFALAQGLAKLPAYRVVGGGDTVNAIEQQHLASKFDHISIGGGAMVEFIEGKRMPGLEPLYEN